MQAQLQISVQLLRFDTVERVRRVMRKPTTKNAKHYGDDGKDDYRLRRPDTVFTSNIGLP